MIDEILNLIEKHEDWRGRHCLNLIPSENIMSPSVRRLLSSDFGHRYTSRNDFYMGTRFTNEIEYYGEKLAREIFEADVSDLRPLSGHVADLIVLANLTKPGDTIIGVSPDNGGYPGLWNDGLAGLLKLNTIARALRRLPRFGSYCRQTISGSFERRCRSSFRFNPQNLFWTSRRNDSGRKRT